MRHGPQLTFHPGNGETVRWQVGDVTVTRVVDGLHEFPRGFLPALTDERIEACMPWAGPYLLADRSRLLLSTHSFVVETPDHVVVVDTCVGAHDERPMGNDPAFLQRLAEVVPGGLAGVDVVVCTHLHFDHVGWNTREDGDRLVPTFPNARYVITDDELRATQADDHMQVIEPSVRPLLDAGVVDAVASDHQIDAHLRLRPSPGHSPGHVCVVIDSAGARALITGDAAHSPMQFACTPTSVPRSPTSTRRWRPAPATASSPSWSTPTRSSSAPTSPPRPPAVSAARERPSGSTPTTDATRSTPFISGQTRDERRGWASCARPEATGEG